MKGRGEGIVTLEGSSGDGTTGGLRPLSTRSLTVKSLLDIPPRPESTWSSSAFTNRRGRGAL